MCGHIKRIWYSSTLYNYYSNCHRICILPIHLEIQLLLSISSNVTQHPACKKLDGGSLDLEMCSESRLSL